jgi:hypothetical protein
MAKLLETRLPVAISEVDPGIYNRLVRILEVNLGRFDPTATPQYNDSTLNETIHNAGDVVWNTSKQVLQVYIGGKWQDISTRTEVGVEATGNVGSLSVITNGAITVSL